MRNLLKIKEIACFFFIHNEKYPQGAYSIPPGPQLKNSIIFTLIFVYRKHLLGVQEFSQIMQYLLVAYSIDITGGNCHYDLLKVTKNKLSDIFADHVQIVNKTTHISGSLIDLVYIKKTLMKHFSINVTVENLLFRS